MNKEVIINIENPKDNDLISRQAVLNLQYRIDDSATLSTRDVVNVDDIENLPTVKPQELKTGHWIRFKEFENGYYHIKCSECGQYWSVDGHAKIFKHCFNCGAKMVES